MQEKVNLEVEKEVYDMIQMLKEILPSEDGEKFDDNEVLKMVLWTFMAFVSWEDEDSHEHWHCWCSCGH